MYGILRYITWNDHGNNQIVRSHSSRPRLLTLICTSDNTYSKVIHVTYGKITSFYFVLLFSQYQINVERQRLKIDVTQYLWSPQIFLCKEILKI